MTTYLKTEVGQRAFKERSPALSPRQRAAFILIDGQRTVDAVLDATTGMGITLQDFAHMVAEGFLAAVNPDPAPSPPTPQETPQPQMQLAAGALMVPSESVLYQRAYPLATQITASLGLRGFRLNLAVEAASGYRDLVALLPKIRAAVGDEKCRPLTQALASP